jgi:hypothetical protein
VSLMPLVPKGRKKAMKAARAHNRKRLIVDIGRLDLKSIISSPQMVGAQSIQSTNLSLQ